MYSLEIGQFVELRGGICGIIKGTMPHKQNPFTTSGSLYDVSYALKLSEESKKIHCFDYYQFLKYEIAFFGFCENNFYWKNEKKLI